MGQRTIKVDKIVPEGNALHISSNLKVGNVYVSSNLKVDTTTISTKVSGGVPSVSWATSIGGTGTDSGEGIAMDSGGNVYVIGQYSDSVTIGHTTLTSVGSTDAFVAKYDTSGTFQWARSIGGQLSDNGYGIATDSDGNVYVTGTYSGTATFKLGTTLTSVGSSDAFVAKYDTSGEVQWAKSIGGGSADYGYGIATDSGGNVYVIGDYQGTADFGPNISLTSTGSSDVFVAKYDTSGTPQWAKSMSGSGNISGLGIATDSGGNVYVTGNHFGFFTVQNISFYSNVGGDAFVAKFDTSGTVQWAKSIGGTSSVYGHGIATDSAGNVYVTGRYGGAVTFGSSTLPNEGSAYVAKYDTSGTPQWATSIGDDGSTYVSGRAIATDSNGNVCVTGDYSGASSMTIGSTTLTNAGSNDAFVAKFDTSGTVQWALGIGGTGFDYGKGIATDSAENVYVVGDYSSGSITIGSTTLPNAGSSDIFVAKYPPVKNLRINTGLEVGTANLYVDTASGRVGIGTSSPFETLDVYGGFLMRPERTTTTYSGAWNRSDGNTYYDTTPQSGSDIDVIYSKNAIYTTTGGLKVSPPSNDSEFYYTMEPVAGVPYRYFPLSSSITSPYLSGDVFSSTRFKADNIEDFTGFAIGQDYEAGDTLLPDYYQNLDIARAHSAHMYFKTASPDGSLTEKMRITNAGNVGIGTTSPGAELHVVGNAYVTSNLEVGGANLFVDTQTSRVGVGTRAPDATLHVEGNVYASSNLEVGGANLFVDTVNSRVGIGTTTPGYTLDVQGDLNVSGTTTNVSDKRLKSNVHVIENALEKVVKLSGYTFTMNNKQNAGVIAQEVLEVLPEVVGGSEETTYSVAYGNMASLFIEAIKELKREIEVLKTKD